MSSLAPEETVHRRGPSITAAARLVPVLFLIGWVAAAGFTSPAQYPAWYRCPLHSVTGWYCAGCGSTRATHHLVQGDILASIRQNPLVLLLGLPAACWIVLSCIRPRLRACAPGWIGWVVLTVILSFWTFRNVPHPALELLRPVPISDSIE